MMIGKNLNVSSWVIIREGCPISYRVNGRDEIEFRCGSQWDGFDFVFDAPALREFVAKSRLALTQVASSTVRLPDLTAPEVGH